MHSDPVNAPTLHGERKCGGDSRGGFSSGSTRPSPSAGPHYGCLCFLPDSNGGYLCNRRLIQGSSHEYNETGCHVTGSPPRNGVGCVNPLLLSFRLAPNLVLPDLKGKQIYFSHIFWSNFGLGFTIIWYSLGSLTMPRELPTEDLGGVTRSISASSKVLSCYRVGKSG